MELPRIHQADSPPERGDRLRIEMVGDEGDVLEVNSVKGGEDQLNELRGKGGKL